MQDFDHSSLTSMIFVNICQTSEVRNYLYETFRPIFKNTDFSIFENIDLKLIFASWKDPMTETALERGSIKLDIIGNDKPIKIDFDKRKTQILMPSMKQSRGLFSEEITHSMNAHKSKSLEIDKLRFDMSKDHDDNSDESFNMIEK